MRSIATPNDHIDMKNSTKATALATQVIDAHIPTRSTAHPPSYCDRIYGRSRVLYLKQLKLGRLLQCEVHGDGHDNRHRYAVEQRRRELPLLHRVERRLIEQR